MFRFDASGGWNDLNTTAAVFHNANPIELIYTVEGLRSIAYERDFVFSNDMQYFLFVPQQNLHIERPELSVVLEFYGHGRLMKAYTAGDIVRNKYAIVPGSTSTVSWLERWTPERLQSPIDFNPLSNVVTIKTIDDLTYLIDITTGEIIEGPAEYNISIFAIVIIIINGIAFLFVKRKHLSKHFNSSSSKNDLNMQ